MVSTVGPVDAGEERVARMSGWWHVVEGVRLPVAIGGHPALDFCNTEAGWGGERRNEYLVSPRALAVWATSSGLLPASRTAATPAADAGTAGPEADGEAEALARALRLRDALHRCVLGRESATDWELVSAEATAARAASRLVRDGSGPARWIPAPGMGPARRALHAAAAAAEELVTSPLLACVSACPGADCGWLFADPRRRRRWCSMAWCGNREKARRWSERHGQEPERAPEITR